jgi:hypothetical protein
LGEMRQRGDEFLDFLVLGCKALLFLFRLFLVQRRFAPLNALRVENEESAGEAALNSSFERTPLRGCARSGRERASAFPRDAGAAQLAAR